MACGPDTFSKIVGREVGARTCWHVRPGRLAMLECRFNKTTHHPNSNKKSKEILSCTTKTTTVVSLSSSSWNRFARLQYVTVK